jgi:hypothetical protein
MAPIGWPKLKAPARSPILGSTRLELPEVVSVETTYDEQR